MTIFDYLVLIIVICSVIISTLRGAVKEIISLASWIVALVVANAYGDVLAQWLPEFIPGEITRLIIGFIVLFIGVRLLMALVGRTIEELVEVSGLSAINRLFGCLFGMVRGIVIVLAVVLLCGMTSMPQQAFWQNAKLSPIAVQWATEVLPYLPGTFAQHVHF